MRHAYDFFDVAVVVIVYFLTGVAILAACRYLVSGCDAA